MKDNRLGYWTIERLQSIGCKLKANHNLWCHFEFGDFEISINLDTTRVAGNHFNFKSKPNRFKGHFRVRLNSEEDLSTLMKLII